MKQLLITFIFVLSALSVRAQHISIAPTSIPIWGKAPQTMKITASYRYVQAVWLYAFKTMYDDRGGQYSGGFFALFWNPLVIGLNSFEVRGGAGYFFRRYPTINGTHINFQFQTSYKITDHLGITYQHISNGFGLFNDINPGIDNIGIQFSL